MLSLAGSLLVEISLPKLIIAWTLAAGRSRPAARPCADRRFRMGRTLSRQARHRSSSASGRFCALAGILALGWFGWRTLFRLVEKSFWALNSIVVQPGYAAFREVLRHLAEKLFAKRRQRTTRAKLRAASAAVAGLLVCALALLVLWLVWPMRHLFGSIAEIDSWTKLAVVALANSVVVITGLSRRRRADLGLRRCHYGRSRAISPVRRRAPPARATGASRISPTSMSSASATAFASRAVGRARAAMTG